VLIVSNHIEPVISDKINKDERNREKSDEGSEDLGGLSVSDTSSGRNTVHAEQATELRRTVLFNAKAMPMCREKIAATAVYTSLFHPKYVPNRATGAASSST
jgi:hypothetical protein